MQILLIDDDDLSRESIADFLQDYLKYEVVQATNCEQGLKLFNQTPFPIVISDIKMPGMNGIELLREIKSNPAGKQCDVIMITGFGELKTSIEALRAGAKEYLLKPIDLGELSLVLERINQNRQLLEENRELKDNFNEKLQESVKQVEQKLKQYQTIYSDAIGVSKLGIFSPKMQEIVHLAEKLHEDRDIPVLIEGETGTGKEIIAHLVHSGKQGDSRPFITVNCSAISPSLFESELFGYEEGAFTGAKRLGNIGKLELAQGGTIFLDEIGDLPLEMQPKLLRALQQKEIYRIGGTKQISLDVRVICATNRNLQDMISQGQFRQDLFFRLNTGHLFIPSLRERKEEVAPLASMFLLELSKAKNKKFRTISREAVYLLENYDWPGNVRELRNVLERVVFLYDDEQLLPWHLNFLKSSEPAEVTASQNRLIIDFPEEGIDYKELERIIFKKVYTICGENVSRSARFLNLARNTFLYKIKDKKSKK